MLNSRVVEVELMGRRGGEEDGDGGFGDGIGIGLCRQDGVMCDDCDGLDGGGVGGGGINGGGVVNCAKSIIEKLFRRA
ncbi:Hypothetical predicted protein [Octopus vulgaris]|uniref:Uncharacterized protein n=1 Tax=Octopus vulgaris TaxID=6645 RepID=A0AA36F812_OCTVU|nr:Hypothetical predicted protein [Octopus vulgaris]